MQQPAFRLKDWQIFPLSNTLKREGTEKVIEPKVMDLLVHFCTHPQNIITRDELMSSVWNGTLVSDTSLNWSIAQLRKALDDSATNPMFIKTIPKYGYQLLEVPTVLGSGSIKTTKEARVRRFALLLISFFVVTSGLAAIKLMG